ncbi:hypothetical protein CL656_03080 [bacterium]|nr:hypothetical protein [bacterium]|tara:strand:+ start:2229 stop:3776 length:1548 start_codon:yes stop_codon:yes gene_type:complete
MPIREERLITLRNLNPKQINPYLGKDKLIHLNSDEIHRAVHLCNWQMFVDLGIFTEEEAKGPLVERNLGMGSAITSLNPNRGYLASGLPNDISKPIRNIFNDIFEFNDQYNQITNSGPINEITYGQANSLTGASSLTPEVIDEVLNLRASLFFDRNSSLIDHHLGSLQAALDLNNKAYFHRLLEQSDLKAPETFMVSLSNSDLNILLEDESKAKENFLQLLIAKYPSFSLSTNYFLKVSIGAGGIGLIRTESSNEDFLGMLKFYKATKERNSEVEILVAKPLDIVSLPEIDPLDVENQIAFSPCMTMVMTPDNFILRQAAEQVLKNGTAYIGSMWNIQMQENLLSVLGERFNEFGRLIQSTGYTGILGTDYILTQVPGGPTSLSMDDLRKINQMQGSEKVEVMRSMFDYTLIGDLNARQNGNGVGEKVKTSLLLSGVNVEKAFQCAKTLEGSSENTLELLNDSFGSMQIQRVGDTFSGVVILPSLTPEFENKLGLTTVFVNPQLRPQEFQKLLDM